MDKVIRLLPSRDALGILYNGEWEHRSPEYILRGLTAEQAHARIPMLPHTISDLLSHMQYWQDRRLELSRGEVSLPEDFQFGITDFPDVDPAGWEEQVSHFLATLAELQELGGNEAALEAIVFDDRDIGMVIASHALHNSYHLGQIVTMRQLLGVWPPVEG
ncbi:MAG: DinB family protein [Planctomycetales bacterium]|nr:DinB family protein [bacterium]UNM08347.1 MAG: DinB family protein [Planctomycetales bacterium]